MVIFLLVSMNAALHSIHLFFRLIFSQVEGWVAKSEGWVAKSVARQLATAVLWVRIQTSLKNHKWAT